MLQGQPYQVQIGYWHERFLPAPPGRSRRLALGSETQTRRVLPAGHVRIARLSEVGLRSSGEKLVIDPWATYPALQLLGFTAVFCRSFSGQNRANYGREAGTDARKVADSQQVVENACPGRRTLDQESPGSSPGGAMKPGNDFGRAGLRLFAGCVSYRSVPSFGASAFAQWPTPA
jgi:hypothetical protein